MMNFLNKNQYVKTSIALVGLVSAIVTIYGFIYQQNKTAIQYEIITNSNVLDINTNITKLDIIYDSTSLKQKNQNLRILNIRVKNVGSTNILKMFYDENSPLGLIIENGYLAESPEILNTSNDYLKKNLKISKENNNQISFSSVMLDKSEFYEFKLLILHEKNTLPKLIPKGKISGQREINIINSSEIEKEVPFWQKVFSGNLFVQVVRAILYFIITAVVIILNIFSLQFLEDKMEERRKNKLIASFKATKGYKHKRLYEGIFHGFHDNGVSDLIKKLEILTTDEEINEFLKNWNLVERKKEEFEAESGTNFDEDEMEFKLENGFELNWNNQRKSIHIREMINDGYLHDNNDSVIINKDMKSILKSFIKHLEEKGWRREIFEKGTFPELRK